ncbi:putative vacuolar protein sorting-associated protein 37B isoform X2 [Apostichopus japonicus]|uniref:Putative vacuolar protein sorting-associated protein 37B isoform X2 n=1 Tax=Stichopus japonicus TaxID=307972 RepID=A0A2G8K904_STIJA|nr:putative vacuolar protein sorting-associated protein 37B isoform X2 [Apostichopus japonicus]
MDTSAIVQGVQFQVVQHMNKTELEEFLEKDDRVQSMVDDHSVVVAKKKEKAMVISESQSLSAFNLSNESRLLENRQKLLSLHVENKNARENYERNKRKLDEIASKYSLAAAKKMLETSATKKEEDSEDIATSFMDGEMTVNEFLQSFQTCRLEAHLKRIKADKMRELVNKLPNYQNVTFASPHAAPTIGPPVAAPRDLPRTPHPTPMYQMPPNHPSHMANPCRHQEFRSTPLECLRATPVINLPTGR